MIKTGVDPEGIAQTPNGEYLYVTNLISDDVFMYKITQNGNLEFLNPESIVAGEGAQTILVTPNGQFVYTLNVIGNSISEFKVGSTGHLESVPSSVKLKTKNL